MANAKPTYVEALRAKLQAQAKEKTNSNKEQANSNEFIPPIGTTKIRILPPVDPNDLPYYTHSYNYLKEVGEPKDDGKRSDKMLFSAKYFNVDGKRVKNPIDEFVAKLYKTNDASNKATASSIKRKRRYYLNALVYNVETGKPEFKVIVDNSNEGKLVRVICAAMGLPFMRDVEDGWFDKSSSEIDEDRRYFDLVDIEKGCDFKIIKDKIGEDAWAITYEKSFAIEKPRALTSEEKELLDQRVDLKTYVEYEEDFDVVQNYLSAFLDNGAHDSSAMLSRSTPTETPRVPRKPTVSKPSVTDSSDELSTEEILNELDK